MAYSSILGAESAPKIPSGRDAELLGPSDSSDSGSDAFGSSELHADSDAAGTGERGSATPGEPADGADILPDRVVTLGEGGDPLATGEGLPVDDEDVRQYTELDTDLDTDNAEDEADG